MRKNDFMVTNPTLPPEDKPNTTLIKFLIILAIFGGIGWFIYKKSEDGSLQKFFDSIAEELDEDDNKNTDVPDEVAEAIHNYLLDKYNDDCEFTGKAPDTLPQAAKGGWFKCSDISNNEVYAYAKVVDDEDYEFEDGYLYAKHFWMTESMIAGTVKLYYPEAKVTLLSSLDETSTDFDKNTNVFNFIKKNNHTYMAFVELPRGTGINVNDLTALSNQLSNTIPNYQLDASYEEDEDWSYPSHVFTIKSTNGQAVVVMPN